MDVDLISNCDWDPEYLKMIFSEDFFDMSEHWNATNYIYIVN